MTESRIGGLRFLLFCGVAALLMLALWAGYNVAQMPSLRAVPDLPSETADDDADIDLFDPIMVMAWEADEAAYGLPHSAPGDNASGSGIRIRAAQNSWVEIRNAQGRALFSRILKQDEELTVPTQPGLTLSTGNAGSLDITIDGQSVPKLGAVGDVRRNVPMNPDVFKGMTPDRPAE